jgi:hypothetical protein
MDLGPGTSWTGSVESTRRTGGTWWNVRERSIQSSLDFATVWLAKAGEE